MTKDTVEDLFAAARVAVPADFGALLHADPAAARNPACGRPSICGASR